MQPGKNLKELFTETLKDIYFAEKQILRALPKMACEAASPEFKQAFETHRDETEGQVERLNQVFERLGRPARGRQFGGNHLHHEAGVGSQCHEVEAGF